MYESKTAINGKPHSHVLGVLSNPWLCISDLQILRLLWNDLIFFSYLISILSYRTSNLSSYLRFHLILPHNAKPTADTRLTHVFNIWCEPLSHRHFVTTIWEHSIFEVFLILLAKVLYLIRGIDPQDRFFIASKLREFKFLPRIDLATFHI